MTIETSDAVVLVAVLFSMLIVHRALSVFVAENALECRETGRVNMAIGAIIPFVAMTSGIDGEVQSVVIPVGGSPTIGGVAQFALRRETGAEVVRSGS